MKAIHIVHYTASAITGMFSGAMALIAIAITPFWASLPILQYRESFKALGPFLGSAMIPLMFLSIGLCGVAALVTKSDRLPWVISFCSVFAIVPLYGIVHAPLNDILLSVSSVSSDVLSSLRHEWSLWHWVRFGLGSAAFLTTLVGLKRGVVRRRETI
jgi:Domain of unknown function (DUF1772)